MRSVEQVFEAFKHLKVLIIGDTMIDTYTYGDVRRMSPEASVPVVNFSRQEMRPGGAANVALNVQALGATAYVCSVIGGDQEGLELRRIFSQSKLTSDHLVTAASRITTVKNRIMSGNQHLLRLDREQTSAPEEVVVDRLKSSVLQLLPEMDVVIMEDYDKGVLQPELILWVIEQAALHHVPVVADPKTLHFHLYQNITLFKPNFLEFASGAGCSIDDGQDRDRLLITVDQFRKKARIEKLLLTLSSEGLLYVCDSERGYVAAHLRSVSDVSGAGDTVISIAALCQALGLSLKFTAELANLGGGIVCEYPGVTPVPKERLMKEALALRLVQEL